MSKKKKIILFITIFMFVSLIFFAVPVILDFIDYKSVIKASDGGGCPVLEGARTLTVTKCIRDTPVIAPIRCLTSCPLLDPALTVACTQPISTAMGCIFAASAADLPLPITCANEIKKAIECQACENYYEVKLSEAQFGNLFYGIPTTFTNYKGGGTNILTQAGNQNIFCGNSNIDPILIGIPSVAVNRIEKIKNWFDKYIIAGFSKK